MNSIGKQLTFWKLINEYKIVVPKIQRDYIQGRNNDVVKRNREEFINELIDSLVKNKSMSLNFVYGTMLNNNEFIPIDGQQRLTTLFLLHLYILAKKDDTDKIKILQKKFSYETRYTTNRFLEVLADDLPKLVKDDKNLDVKIRNLGRYVSTWENDPNVVSCIVMFQLINKCYNEKIKNEADLNKIANLLINENCPITFMWLQLPNSFGSDNQLYIRMNSRGKQLTDFENFKAELYEKIFNNDEINNLYKNDIEKLKKKIDEFKEKIDRDWYSMFWKAELCKKDNQNKNFDEKNIEIRAALIDSLLQHIFHWTIVSSICLNDTVDLSLLRKEEKESRKPGIYSRLQPSCDIKKIYIDDYLDLYKNIDNGKDKNQTKNVEEKFFNDIMKNFFKTLNFIKKLKPNEDNKISNRGIFRFLINDIFQINYGKKDSYVYTIRQYGARVLLYSITKFAQDYDLNDENIINDFKSWYRVVLNLVSTQEIDSPEDFSSAIKALKECNFKVCKDVNSSLKAWLEQLQKENNKAFRSAQVNDEILKLDLIRNNEWKEAILSAENTDFDSDYKSRDYFRGQIGFLLHMAEVTNADDLKNQLTKIDDFKYYSKAVKEIFDVNKYWEESDSDELKNCKKIEELLKASIIGKYSFDNLFHRALLTKGNYWIDAPGKNIKTFFVYNESHNNYDWRGAFRQLDDNTWRVAVRCLKELLDYYRDCKKEEFVFEEFKNFLNENIKKFSNHGGTSEDKLSYLLIKHPNLFKYIKNNYYIYWDDKEYPKECSLMRLKQKRAGSIIDIPKDKIN